MNQELCENSQKIRPNLGGLHILLFDPQKSTLAYTKSMLKHAFYTVITTGDQSLALKMLEENAELIDLIMIDDKPQEMDCISFIKKIKATMESIPIVLLSNKEVYLSAALLQIGACRVVSKPISSAQVKSLWKFANIWRKKAYYNKLETAVEDMEKQAMPIKSDAKAKGKLLSVDNYNNKKRQLDGGNEHGFSKKKNYEKFESDHDEQDEEGGGYDRKKTRNYTHELHKKCLDLAQNRNRVSPKAAFSNSSNPFMPSSTLLSMVKDNAGKNSAERVQFPRLNTNDAMFMRSDGSSRIPHSIMKPDFGFPTSRVLGSTPGSIRTSTDSYDIIGMQSRSFHSSQNSYFGEKRIINNDLKRFSKLVDNQTSFLASNGEYMRQRQLSDSQFRPSTTANTLSYSLNSVVNVENNALSAFSFAPPMKTKLPNEGNNLSQWVESVMGQEELYPVSEGFDEISMDEFFKSVFDNPEGSTSSTQSSGLFGGFEANVDHSKTSTLNLKSFTGNDYLNGPIDQLFVHQENFGNGISKDEDILIDIAGQIQLEGIF